MTEVTKVMESDIPRLCTALYHKWEPRHKFVLITAYMDESGTHRPSKTLLIAVFAANARQWRKFEKKALALLIRFGVQRFHAKEFRDGHGDFVGWSRDRKLKFLDEFSAVINTRLEIGCSVILKIDDYKRYYDNEDRPKKLPRDSAYGVCFRGALSFLTDAVLNLHTNEWGTERRFIKIVMEQGHKNAGDAVRIFKELKDALRPEHKCILSSISFAIKGDFVALAACDLLAFAAWRQEEGFQDYGKPKFAEKFGLRGLKTYRKNHYKVEIRKEGLMELKRNLMLSDAMRQFHP